MTLSHCIIAVLSLVVTSGSGIVNATDDPMPPVETILKKWSYAMRLDRPRQIDFNRIVYDHVFHREERGAGSFALDSVGRGRLLLGPVAIDPHAQGLVQNNRQYELKPTSPDQWYWGDPDIYQLNPEDVSACRARRGPDGGIRAIFTNPQEMFPLLMGFKADDVSSHFHWTMKTDWTHDGSQIYLTGRPTETSERNGWFAERPLYRTFSRIDALIDRQSYETIGIRFRDAPAAANSSSPLIESPMFKVNSGSRT